MTLLATEWVRIGRSGATVDGRTIPPLALKQAAKNYKPDLYTALIWPEHSRYESLGKVLELKEADNEESGVDLFARLCPNKFYLMDVSAGQRLFTSMELTPDFRKTGEWYLTGLGATDDPASVATTELHFGKQPEQQNILVSELTENVIHEFNDPIHSKPSFFQRILAAVKTEQETDDMSDEKYTELKNELAALKASLSKFSKAEDRSTDEALALKQENEALKAENQAFKAKEAEQTTQLTALTDRFAALETKLDAALQEQPSTPPSQNHGAAGGDVEDTSVYL